MDWDEPFFKEAFADAWTCIQAVVVHHKSLAIFRDIAAKLMPNVGTDPKKYGETRYGSRVIMGARMLSTKKIYQTLVIDDSFAEWLSKQSRETRSKVSFGCVCSVLSLPGANKCELLFTMSLRVICLPQFADVKKLILDDNFWTRLGVAVKVLEVVLKALRYSDGMKGGSMGLIFSLLLQIQDLLAEPIQGLDENIRKKVSHS